MRVQFLKAIAAAAALVCAFGSPGVRADDDYPSRPITLTHGFGAGGNADAIARIVADGLSRRLGKPVIVEPRPGAGGNIASDRAAKAQPDGYTLIMLTGAHAVSAALYKSLPFDPVDDFQMVSTVVFFPLVVAVKTGHRFQTLADLIKEAKAKPETLTYSSVGVGSTQHLAGELLSSMAGIKIDPCALQGRRRPDQRFAGRPDRYSDRYADASRRRSSRPARSTASASPATSRGSRFPMYRRSPKPSGVTRFDRGSASQPERTSPHPSSTGSIANCAPCSIRRKSRPNSKPWEMRSAPARRPRCGP